MNMFTEPHFQTVEAARAWLEAVRWPDGPICSHCGTIGRAYKTKRAGWYRCAEKACRKDFSVTTGTAMERTHIALNKWLMGFYLMTSSKKGVSSHQLHRALDLDYKSAWFMSHRIRECMRQGGFAPPMGGAGKIVEADETYFGKPETQHVSPRRGDRPYKSKKARNSRPIVALVERGGSVRTFHVPVADQKSVEKIVNENIAHESKLHTDESRLYFNAPETFAGHETVRHSHGEYVRYGVGTDDKPYVAHTNSAEGYFSIFKRGMRGIYQHCKEKHLHRYLAEYDFRYNHRVKLGFNDGERAVLAVKGATGTRLTYRQPH